jgi:hypothetical protein
VAVYESLLDGGDRLAALGARRGDAASSDGLSTVPGQMALQRTPRLIKSAATASLARASIFTRS